MAARNKPYEQFGPFVLFKKLESDALTDLWRAAAIENGALGSLVALRRFHGGSRDALLAAASNASKVVPVLSGTSFVRNQVIDAINDTPFITHEYAGGRSLRHIVDRARGGTGSSAHPIPLDQAIAIAEKVALSLATTADLRFGGERLIHGALIPQFIWISDGGEIRVAGQQLGAGLVASLKNGAVASEVGRYFAPEYQSSGQPTKASEVFSLGAVMYLLVTGLEPPDVANSGFSLAIRGAKTAMGTAMPEDIRSILEKSLAVDPAARYATVADMKQAISALTNSGRYTATTFNLAFYLSTLLKKEIDSEAIERERETKINLAPYLEVDTAPTPVAAPVASIAVPAPVAVVRPNKKKKFPLAVAAVGATVAIGAGAWLTLGAKKAPVATATSAPQLASALTPVVPKPIAAPEPIIASASPETAVTDSAPVTATQVDEAARKKAFEDAVKEQLQQELLKLQAEYTRQLQKQQARNAPVLGMTTTSAPVTTSQQEQVADDGPSAAELDSVRRENAARAQQLAAQQLATPEPITQTQPALTTHAPAPAVVEAPVIREGDVVDLANVDTPPRVVRDIRPVYPVIAARQKIVATILTTILLSETGEVLEVKVLRGEPRFGFNEAAVRALRAARYSPAMKDGKRVKTWLPQIIQFKP